MMQATQAHFSSILGIQNEIPGINGILVTNHTQTILAQRWLETEFKIEQVTSLAQEVLAVIHNFSEESRLGKFSSMHQEGTFGQLYILRWSQYNLFIILAGSTAMNIGMARAKLESILHSIDS
jgi:predicted regulator of Ras-like GTPase activity (Roadblock/LC7/MglB family)